MLHQNSLPPTVNGAAATWGGEQLTIAELLVVARRYARVTAATTAFAIIVAILYLVLAEPSFVARTLLVIEPEKSQAQFSEQKVDPGQVESQVEILRSQKISDEVIRTLDLTSDSEFAPGGRSFSGWLSELMRNPQFTLDPGTGSGEGAERLRMANFGYSDRLNVRRLGQSYVIEVSFRSNDPAKSARIANAITDVYLAGTWRLDKRSDRFRRFSDTVEKDIVTVGNARVITLATPPLRKSSPQTTLVLVIATLLGGLAGISISLVNYALDRSVRSAQQLKHLIDVDCLGSLPSFGRCPSKVTWSKFTHVSITPSSPFSDAMQGLKNAIDYAALSKPVRCLGVTSASPGEGKSIVAANLALLYAIAGSRALVIDLSIRNPTLTQLFSPHAKAGLLEALAGKPVETFSFGKTSKASLLPLVGAGQIASTLDLVKSRDLEALLNTLQQTYAPIIIDLPSASDVRPIGALLDGHVIIADWGKTPVETLRKAVGSIESAQGNVLGFLINKRTE